MNEDAPNGEEDVILAGQQDTDLEPNADPSPDSEGNHEQKPNGVEKRINELTAKRYQAERRAEEAERKLAESAAEKPAVIADAPEAPSLPSDMYDTEAMQAYHASMIKYTQDVSQASSQTSFQAHQREEAAKVQQSSKQKRISKYAQNAVRDGVDVDKLKLAETELVNLGISDDLGVYIMEDPNGAKIVEHLYDNPALMHEILSLDPVSAGIKIASEVKAQALRTTPRVSGAPEPTPEISGGGVSEKDDFARRYPGTTFN